MFDNLYKKDDMLSLALDDVCMKNMIGVKTTYKLLEINSLEFIIRLDLNKLEFFISNCLIKRRRFNQSFNRLRYVCLHFTD